MSSVPLCEPCHRGNNPSTAVSWCSDCTEPLCNSCDNAHRINKSTLMHTLLRIEDMPTEMAASLQQQKICRLHSEHVLELYCSSHDALCCRTCMTERHRGCERLQTLDDVSKGIRQSALLKNVESGIQDMLQTLQNIETNRTENVDRLEKQRGQITKSISDVKQKIVDRLDALEHALISELETLHLTMTSEIEKQQEETAKLNEKITGNKNDMDFIKEYGSNNQVFVTLQRIKRLSKEQHKELKIVSQSLKDINIIYNQAKNQESYFMTLGTLSTRTDSFYHVVREQRQVRKNSSMLPLIVTKTPRTNQNQREKGLNSGSVSKLSSLSSASRKSHTSVNNCKPS